MCYYNKDEEKPDCVCVLQAFTLTVPSMPTGLKNRVILDAIHGLVHVDPSFWRVVDSPEVQRLRWIKQTGLAYLVYPGAEHSRFAHAIGVYSLARRVFQHLRERTNYTGNLSPSYMGWELEQAFATAALCHDLGHTAFSHVLEPILLPAGFSTHEDCTLALLQGGAVKKQIQNIGCDLEQVVQLVRGVHWNDALCKLLSGHIDVDRWDYLMRDAASSGVVYGQYDLEWLINSLSIYPDTERRPRLLLEVHRGLAAIEHFFTARRSMYQQVYYHTTVRGAERLLRAVFERASDPQRPAAYKEDTNEDVPECLCSFLRGDRPSIGEFLSTDDTTIIAALKRWGRSAKDPVLRFLAKCLLERRLFKEIRISGAKLEQARNVALAEIKSALARQKGTDLPVLDAEDQQALDYFVLLDECEFKPAADFDGVLFDSGNSIPQTIAQIKEQMKEYVEPAFLTDQLSFTRKRLFVLSDVADSVRTAIMEVEKL